MGIIDVKNIVSTQSFDAFLEDYCRLAISSESTPLPPKEQKIGNSIAKWEEIDPGVAIIKTAEGNPTDQLLAELAVREQLSGHGIEQAEFSFDVDKTKLAGEILSNWQSVELKAKRLIQSGNVQIIRNGATQVVANVKGDHGEYQPSFSRQDPNSQAIDHWTCACKWGQYSWGRTRQFKRFEGRPCAHVLATYWTSRSMPTDEERAPGNQQGQTGQMSLFDQSGGVPSSQMGIMQQAPVGSPGMVPANPGLPIQAPAQMGIPGQAPQQPPGLLPQFPGSPAVQPATNPVSVPGLKQPTPLNPIQYLDGTFSSVGWQFDPDDDRMEHMAAQEFINGQMVSNKQDEPMAQWVGLNGGGTTTIAAGSIGEVRGTDPLGTVEVYFAGPASDNGNLQPHGTVGWFFPSQITPRPDVKPGGPAVRRR